MFNAPQYQDHGHMHALWTNDSHRLVKGKQKDIFSETILPTAYIVSM